MWLIRARAAAALRAVSALDSTAWLVPTTERATAAIVAGMVYSAVVAPL